MTYIQIKPGVDMSRLSPEIWAKAQETADVFDQHGYPAVITSAFRPEKPGSLHHGFALDWRANHIAHDWVRQQILSRLKELWGPDHDVILHGDGPNIHYHVEYDPD